MLINFMNTMIPQNNTMADNIILTEDGSYTIVSSVYGETYHSIYGAKTESMKIFIEYGLDFFQKNNDSHCIKIFEVGFGSGLNAFLTYSVADKNLNIEYNTIELYPIEEKVYCAISDVMHNADDKVIFKNIHNARWDALVRISENFSIRKIKESLLDFVMPCGIDVVYFDAFSPNVQPELWTTDIFKRIFDHMNNGGVLTTYCAKGQVRRNLKEAGFYVERLEGPPHKREVLRATKL